MFCRKFPWCSHDISILGFWAMRLPLAGDQQDVGIVDEQQAIEMIRAAVNVEANYIDAAYQHWND
jgi:predicted aldo/keto reductase-like oxidoreductase